jgi:hypothetical protein
LAGALHDQPGLQALVACLNANRIQIKQSVPVTKNDLLVYKRYLFAQTIFVPQNKNKVKPVFSGPLPV